MAQKCHWSHPVGFGSELWVNQETPYLYKCLRSWMRGSGSSAFSGFSPLRACSRPPVRAQSRSEPAHGRLCALRACSWPPAHSTSMLPCAPARFRFCVRICSSMMLAAATLSSVSLHSDLFTSVNVDSRVHTSICVYIRIYNIYIYRERERTPSIVIF